MRQLNFDSINEKTEGEFKKLAAGNYVCVITEAVDVPNSSYVRLLIDIADGEFKGMFSDSFYDDKPWAHAVTLSYKDTALDFLKGRLHVISDCNPGFDAMAAWNGGEQALQMFVGKLVGVTFNEEEYQNDKGEKKVGIKVGSLVRTNDIRDGKVREPRHKKLDGTWISIEDARAEEKVIRDVMSGYSSTATSYAGGNEDDIPFS